MPFCFAFFVRIFYSIQDKTNNDIGQGMKILLAFVIKETFVRWKTESGGYVRNRARIGYG